MTFLFKSRPMVAMATALLVSGVAHALPSPGTLTWAVLNPVFVDGNLSGTYDFASTGQGTIDFSITNPSNSTRDFTTNSNNTDLENHPSFPAITGDNVTLTAGTARRTQTVTFDFSNFTGVSDALVLGLDHVAGNASGFGGTNIIFNQALSVLSDINSTGALAGDQLSMDVVGSGTGDGDFLLGGFQLGSQLVINFDTAARDGLRFALGSVPVPLPPPPPEPIPAPATLLLLLAGVGLLRKRVSRG